jgi:hypothetical protein
MRADPTLGPVFLLLALVACGSEPSALDPEEIFGTFALVRIGEQSLPTSSTDLGQGYASSTISGNLTLDPDFTYKKEHTERRVWPDGSSTTHLRTEEGTWSLGGQAPRGGKLTLHDTTSLVGFTWHGQARPRKVTVSLPVFEVPFLYRR